MKLFHDIARQIYRQATRKRPKGHVRVTRTFGYTPPGEPEGEVRGERIVWRKRYYVLKRDLPDGYSKSVFDQYADTAQTRSIGSPSGSFFDSGNQAFTNACYAVKLFSKRQRRVQFEIECSGAHMAFYVGAETHGYGRAIGDRMEVRSSPDWPNDQWIGYNLIDRTGRVFEIVDSGPDWIDVDLNGQPLSSGVFTIRDPDVLAEVSGGAGVVQVHKSTLYVDLLAGAWHTVAIYAYMPADDSYFGVRSRIADYADGWREVDFERPRPPRWTEALAASLTSDVEAGAYTLTVDDASSWPASGSGSIDGDAFYYGRKEGNVLRDVVGLEASHSAGATVRAGAIATGYDSIERGTSYVTLSWDDPPAPDLGGVGVYRAWWEASGYTLAENTTGDDEIVVAGDARDALAAGSVVRVGDTRYQVRSVSYDSSADETTLALDPYVGGGDASVSASAGETVYVQRYTKLADVPKGQEFFRTLAFAGGELIEFVLDAYDNSEFGNRSEKADVRVVRVGERSCPPKPSVVRVEKGQDKMTVHLEQHVDSDNSDIRGWHVWGRGKAVTRIRSTLIWDKANMVTCYSVDGFSVGDRILVDTTDGKKSTTVDKIAWNDLQFTLPDGARPVEGGEIRAVFSTTVQSVVDSYTFTVADASGIRTDQPLLLKDGSGVQRTAEVWAVDGNTVTLRYPMQVALEAGDRVSVLEKLGELDNGLDNLVFWRIVQMALALGRPLYERIEVPASRGASHRFWVSSFDKAGNELLDGLACSGAVYSGVGTVADWGQDNLVSSFDELAPETYPYADEVMQAVGRAFASGSGVVSPIAVVDLRPDEASADYVDAFDVVVEEPLYWGTGSASGTTFTADTRHTPDDPDGNADFTDAIVGGKFVDSTGTEYRIMEYSGNQITLDRTGAHSGDYGILSGGDVIE